MVAVDDMNRRILNLLKTDGKLTYREIAAKLRRSPSTVRDRIRRMEDYNVILGYAAIVDREITGMKADAIVLADVEDGVAVRDLRKLNGVDGVAEVSAVSGDRRVIIRVRARDSETLDTIISSKLIPAGLKDVEVRIIMEEIMRFPGTN